MKLQHLLPQNWQEHQQVMPRRYTCGHCGIIVAGDRGYAYVRTDSTSLIADRQHIV